jgi:hypothetical protein
MKLIPEKDKTLNCWIVWETHKNYKIDRYRAKTRKECLRWIATIK